MSSVRNNSRSTKKLRSLSKNKTLASNLNFQDDSLSVLEKYSESLNKLFSYYAGIGEPMNQNKMKSIKFHRLLKDAGLLDHTNSISSRPRPTSRGNLSQSSRQNGKNTDPTSELMSPVDIDLIFV